MDVYSLGVLCLWLTFYEKQHHKGQPFPEYLTSKIRSPLDLKETIFETSGISDKAKIEFAEFFDATLALDPDRRTSDLTECISLLTPKPEVTSFPLPRPILTTVRARPTSSDSIAEQNPPTLSDFHVSHQVEYSDNENPL